MNGWQPLLVSVVIAVGLSSAIGQERDDPNVSKSPPPPSTTPPPPSTTPPPPTTTPPTPTTTPPADILHSPHDVDQEVLRVLNPYFLEIAHAAILEDQDKLYKISEALNGYSRRSLRFQTAIGMAQLVIFDLIPAKDAYVSQFGQICSWERLNFEQAEAIATRLTMYRADLKNSGRDDWDALVVREAMRQLWAGPDKLTITLARDSLQLVDSFEERVSVLTNVRERALEIIAKNNPGVELKAIWHEGRQDLSRMLIELYAAHFKFSLLWPEVREYLNEFGEDGKHSPQILALAMSTLNRARTENIDFQALESPDSTWFEGWFRKLDGKAKVETVNNLMRDSWRDISNWKYDSLPIGRITLDELLRDPRLRVPFSAEFTKPLLGVVLERMQNDTGVILGVGGETSADLFLADAANFAGPLHSAMRIVAKLETVQGDWERTSDGYLLHSSMKNPTTVPRSRASRYLFWGVNVAFFVVVAGWLAARRKTPTE